MIDPVKECAACGEVCSTMDTSCPRCRQYGTLRERFQCQRCQRLLDTSTSCPCEAEQITAETSGRRAGSFLEGPLETPNRPDVVDPRAPHPALAAGVGGAVFGATAGAVAGHFFLSESPLILGLIGWFVGGVVGAVVGGNVSQGRR